MKKIIILALICVSCLKSVAGSFMVYTPGNMFDIKNNSYLVWGKFEFYNSNLAPEHIRAFRIVTTCGNDLLPDRKLTLIFIDDTTLDVEPLPGQMWRRVQMTSLGNIKSTLVTSMCFSMTDEVIKKITSTPLKQIEFYTAKKNKKTKESFSLECLKIKDANGLKLQADCLREIRRLEEIHSESSKSVPKADPNSSADFYNGF